MISMTWPQYLRRQCTVDGRVVALGRTEVEIISALLIAHPSPVKIPELIERVYPDPDLEPDYATSVLTVIIHRFRRKFPNQITNRYGLGYHLDQPPH